MTFPQMRSSGERERPDAARPRLTRPGRADPSRHRRRWYEVMACLVLLCAFLGPVPRAWATPELPAPAGWPLAPEPEVLRGFEPPAQRWGAGNRGLDLAATAGQPVLAVAGGTVSFAGSIGGNGVVVVDHGGVRTTYTPVAPTVAVGARVGLGQPIGEVRGTHCPERVCLHLGLRDGDRYLDPGLLFASGSVDPGSRPRGPVRLLPPDRAVEAQRLAAARKAARERAGAIGSGTFVRPSAGAVTSSYGMRVHPITGIRKLHDGIDFGAPCGSELWAPADGTVVTVDRHPALGNRIVIDHGDIRGHRVRSALNHASSQAVRPGQRVRVGEVVGRVGSTGLSTGCHLHFMVWVDDRLTDPAPWL
ncbi:peptidoglycan DD-metalloendopeptidase family protein [Microlunatus sp. Y2014]|uniref:M23 family metallopeptidase n=1 Tax=Microlunatus sp. Y2014 TaxID=3418488 RepID=UPI003DA76397